MASVNTLALLAANALPRNPAEIQMLAVCRDLGAEVEYRPEYGHFTAMVWEGWALPHDEGKALSIQD